MCLSIILIHSWLWVSLQKVSCFGLGWGFYVCFLSGWICSCFPRAPMQKRMEEIPQSPPFFSIDFQQCIQWGSASSHISNLCILAIFFTELLWNTWGDYDIFMISFFQDIRGITPSPLQNDGQRIYYFFFRLHHLSLLGYQDTQSCCNINSQCTKTQFACCRGKMLRTRWNELCFCLNLGRKVPGA